jgi:SHS2 domain-containing protein
MYEHFEHTADLGLRVRSPDLDTLFVEAGEALMAAIVEDVTTIEPRQDVEFRIAGDDRAYLLFDWLKALLLKFEIEHLMFREFEVKVAPAGLTATARGESYDPDRHPLSHEVKAITYHGLVVEPADGGWRAEVIVDI